MFVLPPNAGCVVCGCPKAGAGAVEPKSPPEGWVVLLPNKEVPPVVPNTGALNPVVAGLPKVDCPKGVLGEAPKLEPNAK